MIMRRFYLSILFLVILFCSISTLCIANSGLPGVVILVGPPLSGKGYLADKLVTSGKFQHLSVGELLRKKSAGNPKAAENMRSGKLVNQDLVNDLLSKELKSYSANPGGKVLLLDGYPRSVEQVDFLAKMLQDSGVTLKSVIYISCPDEVLFARLEERAKKSGREDDKVDVVRGRVALYRSTSSSILAKYPNKVSEFSCKSKDLYSDVLRTIS